MDDPRKVIWELEAFVGAFETMAMEEKDTNRAEVYNICANALHERVMALTVRYLQSAPEDRA